MTLLRRGGGKEEVVGSEQVGNGSVDQVCVPSSKGLASVARLKT